MNKILFKNIHKYEILLKSGIQKVFIILPKSDNWINCTHTTTLQLLKTSIVSYFSSLLSQSLLLV